MAEQSPTANPPELDQESIDQLMKEASFEAPPADKAAAGAAPAGATGAPAAPDAADLKLPTFQQVIADAQNGITADHLNTTSTTNGPFGGWRRIYDGGSTWRSGLSWRSRR